MKKSIMTLMGCALVAGVASAATSETTTTPSVPGNNTAVVIQKTANKSTTGFQFLCVPVSGFDITGAADGKKTIPLNDVLSADTYTYGKVQIVKVPTLGEGESWTTTVADAHVAGAGENYSVSNGAWKSDTTNSTVTNPELAPGTILWFRNVNLLATLFAMPSNTTEGDTEPTETPKETTVFCGELMTAQGVLVVPTAQGIAAYGNYTSVDVAITALCENPAEGDQIYVTKAGSADYTVYQYFFDGWNIYDNVNGWLLLTDTSVTDDLKKVPAGEAFYYYAVSNPSTPDVSN